MPRYAAKKDANHDDVADGLRADGWSVYDTSRLGDGFPDIAIGKPGIAVLVEIKDGSKPPSARQLTPEQVAFAKGWEGPYIVAISLEDARTKLMELLP